MQKKLNDFFDDYGCKLPTAGSSNILEIDCGILRINKFNKLFKKDKLHDHEYEINRLIKLQSDLKTKCHAMTTPKTEMSDSSDSIERTNSPIS